MNKKALDHSLEFIDSWLKFRYDRVQMPGYVVAIAHKGTVIFNEAYGFADLESKTKLTPQHVFRIASHSKTFTSTALMLLAEERKLRIDDYVVDYLPWLKKHKDPRWSQITVRQLMSHGAGVIRDGETEDYWQLEQPFPDTERFKREIMETKLVIDNNTKLKYSNYGYTLLGLVIEAVSGISYNQFVDKRIIRPLDLKNTDPEYTKAVHSKLVTGYSRQEFDTTRLPIAQVSTFAMSPATGFCSTAEDLCAYFTAQMVGSGKLLSDESKKEMQRVQWHANGPGRHEHTDYGLGIEIDLVGKRRIIGHGGGFPGHSTKSMADPKDELVVVVLTNCIDGPGSWIAKGIFSIIDYFQENTPATKPKHDLLNLEGRYANLWFMTNIVVTGDKIVAAYPESWEPFSVVEKLEYVDDTTLKAIDTDSFSSEGELVRFNIKDGTVDSIRYAGSTMWPEEVWAKKQRSRKVVD
jgi:D-alanyl-D-alanine carboxypeptidase